MDETTDLDKLLGQIFGSGGIIAGSGLHGGIDPVIIANRIKPYFEGLVSILNGSEYINEDGLITDPELLKELQDWSTKVAQGVVGDGDLSTISSNYPLLEDLSGWGSYYSSTTGNEFSGDTEDTEEQDPNLKELIEKYGEDVVGELQNKYEELKDFVGTIPEDPVGAIKKMADIFIEGAAGIPPDCVNVPGGPTTGPWLRDCVTVGVLIDIGFPGLPSGMGGIFKGATIGEIQDGLAKIGRKFEDILDGNPTCGKDGDQECTPEQILKDLGDWVVGSVGDIFKDDETGHVTVGSVLGTLGGVFGSVLGGVIYGQFKDKINNEIENVIGVPVIPFAPLDECEKNGQTTVETSAGSGQFECGPCKQEGFTPTGPNGECVDPNIVDTPTEGQSEEECNQLGRTHVPDASNETKGSCGGCKDDINTIPDDPDNPDYSCVPFDDPNPQEGDPCNTGAPLNAEGTIGPAPDFDCVPNEGASCNDPNTGASGAIKDGLCDSTTTGTKCEDEFSTNYGQDGDCGPDCVSGYSIKEGDTVCSSDGTTGTNCDPITSDNADECGKTDCGDGVFVDKGKQCPGGTGCPEGQKKFDGENCEDVCPYDPSIPASASACQSTGGCPAKGTVIESGCDGTTFFMRFADGECGEIYDSVPGYSGCGGGGYTCDDPNATVREDGSCGPCKAGYVFDGSVERCVQESTNPCSDPAYAAANPDECGTTPPPPETPSGGGNRGGSAGGMFSVDADFQLTGDPQLLAKMQFPIENFLQQYVAGMDNQNTSITSLFEDLV